MVVTNITRHQSQLFLQGTTFSLNPNPLSLLYPFLHFNYKNLLTALQVYTTPELIYLALGALLVGMEKAGFKGLSMLVVSIYAMVMGGKASAGLLLLFFMLADIFAVRHYYQEASFSIVRKLLGPAAIGIILGAVAGQSINDAVFKDVMAIVILVCLGLSVGPSWWARGEDRRGVVQGVGFLTGFSTMIANVSSPILAVYLLSLHLPKVKFIGTVVWFFFIINFFKLPFHIWGWETIQWETLGYSLLALPLLGLGFLLGLWGIKRVSERSFRWLIVGVTFLAAARLLLS